MIITIYTLREHNYNSYENTLEHAQSLMNFEDERSVNKYYKPVYTYETNEFDKYTNVDHMLIAYILKKFNTQSEWPDNYNYSTIKLSDLIQIDDKLYYIDGNGFHLVNENCEVVHEATI